MRPVPPPEAAVKRKWLVLGLFLLVCTGLSLCMLAPDPWVRRGPVWDKYQQVRLGMTEEEVNADLGPPDDVEPLGGVRAPWSSVWFFQGGELIAVDFDTDGRGIGRATGKRFHARRNSWWVEDPPRSVMRQAWDMLRSMRPW